MLYFIGLLSLVVFAASLVLRTITAMFSLLVSENLVYLTGMVLVLRVIGLYNTLYERG
jgi:hypothetical protein